MNYNYAYKYEVTLETTIKDIILYVAVGLGIASQFIELTLLDDFNRRFNISSKNATLAELGFPNDAKFQIDILPVINKPFQFTDFFPSEVLSKSDIHDCLIKLLNNSDDQDLLKSAWLLVITLKPIEKTSFNLAEDKTMYSKLYHFKIFNYMSNKYPNSLKSKDPNFDKFVAFILNEKPSRKLLKSSLTFLSTKKAEDAILKGGDELFSFLIESFIENNSDTLCEKILIVLRIALETKKVNDFGDSIIGNEFFLSKCVELNSSESFKNKDVIKDFISKFSPESKKVIFEFCSRNFMKTSSNCFSLFMATYQKGFEVEEITNKSLSILTSDIKEYSDEYIKSLADFVSFILNERKELIVKTRESSIKMVQMVFKEMNSKHQEHLFKVILCYVKNDPEQVTSKYLVNVFESFETDKWWYDWNANKKLTKFCGLKSLGNTCYMNAILQQLAHNTLFRNLLFEHNDETNLLVVEIQKIFALLELTSLSSVSTRSFGDAWKNVHSLFNPRLQEDASEFFGLLIDNLPEKLQKAFDGKQIQTWKGISTPFEKSATDPFFLLPIELSAPFYDAIKTLFEDQLLVGSNQYEAEGIGKIDAKMKTRIEKLPNTLVIQLKRFKYSYSKGKKSKIYKEYLFPLSFNAKDCFAFPANPDNSIDVEYVLKGAVVHAGSTEKGHYSSIIKVDNDWVLFNDSETEVIDDNKFKYLTKGSNYSKNPRISWAYLLFYEARNPKTHEIIFNPISFNESDDKNEVITHNNVNIPEYLTKDINKENESYIRMQSFFSSITRNFVLDGTNNIEIILAFVLGVFSHSHLVKDPNQFFSKVKKIIPQNCEAAFNYIFDASSDNSDSADDTKIAVGKTMSRIIYILNKGPDVFLNPLISLFVDIVNSKSQKYAAQKPIDAENLKKDENVLFRFLQIFKDPSINTNVVKHLGRLADAFAYFYSKIFDESVNTRIVHQVIDIINTIYNNGQNSQIDTSVLFKMLKRLTQCISDKKPIEDFVESVRSKVNSVSKNSFEELESVFNPCIISNNKNYEQLSDGEISKLLNKMIDVHNSYLRESIEARKDSLSVLSMIEPGQSDFVIAYLSSKEFNPMSFSSLLNGSLYEYQRPQVIQLIVKHPLIITKLSFYHGFKDVFNPLLHYVFPYIQFGQSNAFNTAFSEQMLYQAYKFVVDSLNLIIAMIDFPFYPNSFKIMGDIFMFLHNYISFLTKEQKNRIFDLLQKSFLSLTSCYDDDGTIKPSNDKYALEARERRKYPSMNINYIISCYSLFDVDLIVSSFEKYSKYYVKYAVGPLKNGEYDFPFTVGFKNMFSPKPETFIEFLRSPVLVNKMKVSPAVYKFIQKISDMMSCKSVRDVVLFELMPQIPLVVLLNRTFLKLAVKNISTLNENPVEANKLAYLFVDNFFVNIKKLVEMSRLFSSMTDIAAIFDGCCSYNISANVSEKAKTAFVNDFLAVMNKSANNEDASKFVATICSQNDDFANFVVTVMAKLLTSKENPAETTVAIGAAKVRCDVMSSTHCWKLMSMVIEFSSDFDNAVSLAAYAVRKSSFFDPGQPIEVMDDASEYFSTIISKLALFVSSENAKNFNELYDSIFSSSVQISPQISQLLNEIFGNMDQDELSGIGLVLGSFIFFEENDNFNHCFDIFALVAGKVTDKKQFLIVLKENFDNIDDSMSNWPVEAIDKWSQIFKE